MTNDNADPSDLLVHRRRIDVGGRAARVVGLALARRLEAFMIGLHGVPIAPAAFATPDAMASHRSRDAVQRTAASDRAPSA